MRKMLKNKKGFTLVELMIVVVIMAILVAVAIPIYNAVTKGVEKNACQANMRVITDNFSAFQMTGNNGGAYSWTKLAGEHDLSALPTTGDIDWAEFKAMFKEGIPVCPTDDKPYTLTVNEGGGFDVTCNCEVEGVDHNADADADEDEGGGAGGGAGSGT